MKKLTEENKLLLKTYCTLKGISGEIDDFGNVLETKKEEGKEKKTTVLGISVKTKGPEIEVKTIKHSLAELMGTVMGAEYDPNDIVLTLVKIGLLEGKG